MCHRRPTDGAPRPGGRGVPRHREAGAHSCRPATAPPVPPRWALPPGVRQPPATDTHPSPRRHTSRTHTRRSRHRRRAPPPPLSLPDDATAAVAATRATSRHVRPRADAKKTRARCPNRDAQAAGRGSGAGQPVGLRPAVGRGGGRCLGHPCRAPRRPLMGGLRAVRPTAGGDTRTGEASAFAATVRLRLTQEEKVGNARTPGHCRQHQLLYNPAPTLPRRAATTSRANGWARGGLLGEQVVGPRHRQRRRRERRLGRQRHRGGRPGGPGGGPAPNPAATAITGEKVERRPTPTPSCPHPLPTVAPSMGASEKSSPPPPSRAPRTPAAALPGSLSAARALAGAAAVVSSRTHRHRRRPPTRRCSSLCRRTEPGRRSRPNHPPSRHLHRWWRPRPDPRRPLSPHKG